MSFYTYKHYRALNEDLSRAEKESRPGDEIEALKKKIKHLRDVLGMNSGAKKPYRKRRRQKKGKGYKDGYKEKYRIDRGGEWSQETGYED